MTSPASRLISLITILQNRPNQKAADLAHNLGVSVRTLHRYLGALDEMGVPIYANRGPYGGFSLVRGYKMPPLIFTPEEAAAVSLGTGLAQEMWGELYREAAQSALAKVEAVLPEAQRSEVIWARQRLVTAGLYYPGLKEQAAIMTKIRAAMKESRRVEMIYHSSTSSGGGKRQMDPYALVFGWGWWYVAGFCHKRYEVRTFRVDRIEELEVLEEQFQPPKDFDAREFMERSMPGNPQVRAKFKFAKEAANLAQSNRIYWEMMEEQQDGSVVVTVLAPDLNWAASSLLAYGPVVEALEPPELRILVKEWAQRLIAMYTKKGE